MHKNLYIARKEQRMTQEKANEIDKYSSKNVSIKRARQT